MLGMPVRRFYAVNVASALAWAPSHILPGVLVGAAFGIFGAAAKPLAILLIVLLVTGWVVLHVVRWTLGRGIALLVIGGEWLRAWAGTHDTWLGRNLTSLFDPLQNEARALALPMVLLIGAAWLFFGILEDVVSGDPLVLADGAIYRALQDLRTAPGDAVMIAITELGDTAVVVESVKAASDVYAPVDGEITDTNGALSADPSLVNSAATSDGWLWKMKLADEGQLAGLMDEAAYKAHIG